MANVRDSDTSLWLHNKLGSSEPWTSGSISSQLNVDVLRNIKECFIDLQTQVKLKLLLSFFHIPKRSVDEWRTELEEILEVAQADSEQWVAMLAEILKSFPTTNCLHIDINEPEENRRIFYDLAEDVTKEMKRGKELNLFPMECHYLNKTALGNVSGIQKGITKHFNMISKPKSLLMRKDLMERASDLANARHSAKKIPAPTIPLRSRGMPRKMTDTTPLKGIPSLPSAPRVTPTPALNQPRTQVRPGAEKKGGIKVLDITEQPVGYAQSKRRKKIDADDKKHSQDEGSTGSGETPDYAAGLPSARSSTPPAVPSLLPPTTPASFLPSTPQPQGLMSPTTPLTPTNFSHQATIPEGPLSTPSFPVKRTQQNNQSTAAAAKDKLPVSLAPTGTTRQPRKTPHRAPPVQQQQVLPPAPPAPAPVQALTTKTVILQVPNHQPHNFVTLSKDLMEKAQEIFKTANRATRPEKEHILKFMAGTRDNPCPELGNIVTIKLSEREETIQHRDGSLLQILVETHFQMNYNTGEWKVITKPPKLDLAHNHNN